MKILRFPTFFFLFHAVAGPVASSLDSGDPSALSSGTSNKEEVSVSSPHVDWIGFSPVVADDEDNVGSVDTPVDFVTHHQEGTEVNGSVVLDPQDGDGQESSPAVQRRLTPKKVKASQQPKKTKKQSKSPTASPMSPPTLSPVTDLKCIDVFTGNRTYFPSCKNTVSLISVKCDSEGLCVYSQRVIKLDDNGNPQVDNDTCELFGEFSYNDKVMVKSPECELHLEPIQLGQFVQMMGKHFLKTRGLLLQRPKKEFPC
ncbi:unnamed protein product [Pseudo-nitzschia multistriata]|uniref:Uncharacterized protein n=1 Tax=Pseudo-nitzschia multistriata TaxID=183589 RepID=A0A448ZNJ7_9STRA|nr:unnamed protein product [Pseudo-nitzschia multistriata]